MAAESGAKAPTIDEHLTGAGFGWYQMRLFCIMAPLVISYGMEMPVLSMLRAPVQREFWLDDYGFASVGSGACPDPRLSCASLCVHHLSPLLGPYEKGRTACYL